MPDTSAPTTSTVAGLSGRELIKGHASLNDFLLLVDPDCQVALSGADIAAVCERRKGVGADGFVRIVRTAALPGAQAFAAAVPEAQWFMDSYHADGSVADMCGNAAHLFAHVLDAEGLVEIPDGASLTIGTRAGARTVTRSGGLWSVDMGGAQLRAPQLAQAEGWDTAVVIPGLEGPRAGLSLLLPAPHTVVALSDEAELAALESAPLRDAASPVVYDPAPEVGTNLEVVVPLGEEIDPETGQAVGVAQVRIWTRTPQETGAYAAGGCAAAVALSTWAETPAPQDYRLLLGDAEVGVHVGPDALDPENSIVLTGTAQLSARIQLP